MNGCKHPDRVTVASWITHDIEGSDTDPSRSIRLRKVTSLRVCVDCGHEQTSTRSPRNAALELRRDGDAS